MGLKLIVDIGNTRTKFAIFQENKLLDLQVYESPESDFLRKILKTFPKVDTSVLSAVRNYPGEFDEVLRECGFFLKMDENTPLPFKNLYGTPQSLGKDRVAIVAGAMARFPKKNVLAVVAGTTITYDFINQDAEYLGGGISPGLTMRFKALNAYTDKLPLVQAVDEKVPMIGNTTKNAILSGVMNGLIAEVDGIMDDYRRQFADLRIIVGGGDYKYFDKRLKNNIFAAPNIVLEGLKEILDFNEEK
ncbi:MAG: type III pantothenate kinase [Bacteroidales bacterium]|nr:type III pantothenate kinase [Bacteroidales bacterium]